jgi:ribosomal protein L40E
VWLVPCLDCPERGGQFGARPGRGAVGVGHQVEGDAGWQRVEQRADAGHPRQLATQDADLLARAQADDDMTVRLAAGASQAAAETANYWSCRNCGVTNEIIATDCTSCGESTLPRSS